MNKRSKAPTRVLAVIALVLGLIIVIVAIASSTGGDDSEDSGNRSHPAQVTNGDGPAKKTPATYVIQTGDTLISIARETGVSVAHIQQLNPEVDPQILISGETLKLR